MHVRNGVFCGLAMLGLLGGCTSSVEGQKVEPDREVVRQQPLRFERYVGTATAETPDYIARAAGHTVALSSERASVRLRGADGEFRSVDMVLHGAKTGVPEPLEPLESVSRYYTTAVRDEEVRHYSKVRYSGVYDGIDVEYHSRNGNLEYDFVVAPGAKPSAIELKFPGADVTLDAEGQLVVRAGPHTVKHDPPEIYQWKGSIREFREGAFELRRAGDETRVSFRVSDYDNAKPLVIDPLKHVWTRYVGGAGVNPHSVAVINSVPGYYEGARAIAVDGASNVYITGQADSLDVATPGAYQETCASIVFDSVNAENVCHVDTFVAKLDPDGGLLWATYLGGPAYDLAEGIAVSGTGVVVAGRTGGQFPLQSETWDESTFDDALNRSRSYVAGFAPDGTLSFSTYLCASVSDVTSSEFTGDVYITGSRGPSDDPATSPAVEGCFESIPAQVHMTGGSYIARLNGSGTFSSITGDFGGDTIAVSDSDEVFVGRYPGVSKLDSSMATELWMVPIQGQKNDMDVDQYGSAYVVGRPGSGFVASPGAFQQTPAEQAEVVVYKVAPDGSGLVYATYLGGDAHDYGFGIAADSGGSAWVTGYTRQPNLNAPDVQQFPATQYMTFLNHTTAAYGGEEAYVVRLDPAGREIVFGISIGGFQNDHGFGIVLDATDAAYVAGATRSYDLTVPGATSVYGALPGAKLNQLHGHSFALPSRDPGDAFVTKIRDDRVFKGLPPDMPLIRYEETAAEEESAGDSGDPVNTHTGELFMTESWDINLGGPIPLALHRYYGAALGAGALGPGWTHNYESNVVREPRVVDVNLPLGKRVRFVLEDGAWIQTGSQFASMQLVEDSSDLLVADARSERIYRYNAAGELTAISDGRGNQHTLTYSSGDLTSIADGLGRTLTFSYASGLLDEVTNGTRTVSYGYTGGVLTSFTDADMEVTTYQYDGAHMLPNLMTSKTTARGFAPWVQTFDADGRVQTQSDYFGNLYSFTYDGVTTQLEDPNLLVTTHEHTESGELVSITDREGNTTSYAYNPQGQRQFVQYPTGRTSSTFRDESGRTGNIRAANNEWTRSVYEDRVLPNGIVFRNLVRIEFPTGAQRTYEHDAQGNVIKATDEGGGEFNYTYNSRGQMLTAQLPNGGVTTIAYNGDGTVDTVTGPASNVTTFAYDGELRLTTVTYQDGASVIRQYDALDRVTQITDARGMSTSFGYDANGNLETVTDALSEVTAFGHDEMDRLVSITKPGEAAIVFTYDEVGNLETILDGGGNTTTYAYDSEGRITTVTDGENFTQTFTYDEEGRLLTQTDANNDTITLARNAAGQVETATSPLGYEQRYLYDEAGRVSAVFDEIGNVTTWEYHPNGLPLRMRVPGGVEITWLRNGLGQITDVVDPNGQTWGFTYDAASRLTTQTDPLTRSTGYTFNNRNRVQTVTYPDTSTQTIGYDGAGNVTSRVYTDGTSLSFTYDDIGRRLTGNGYTLSYNEAGFMDACNGITMDRDGEDKILTMTLAVGKTIQYRYDERDLLEEVEDWTGSIVSFQYDNDGSRRRIVRPSGVDTIHAYDEDGHLEQIYENDGTTISQVFVVRDERGHITLANRQYPLANDATGIPAGSVTYDAASQLNGVTYDALGRLTGDGVRTLTWDDATRLSQLVDVVETHDFTYDASGHILTHTDSGGTDQFVWNYGLRLPSVSILRQSGVDITYFVHTPDGELLYAIDAISNARSYYHFDEVGNTLFLTNDGGSITDTYAYTPYGILTGATGTTSNRFLFGGQYGAMQFESLTYMRARFYDPASRRFISKDPIADPFNINTINPYLYAAANPLTYIDPLGERYGDPEANRGGTAKAWGKNFWDAGQAVFKQWAEEKNTSLADQAKTLNQLNRLAGRFGNRLPGGSKYKAQRLLEGAEKFERWGKAAGIIGDVQKNLDRVEKYLAEGPEAVAKDYLVEKSQDMIKDAVGSRAYGVGEAAITLYKTYEKVREIQREGQTLHNSHLDSLYLAQDELLRQYKAGIWTDEEAAQMLRNISAAFDESVQGTADSTQAGIAEESLRGGSKAASQALDVPDFTQ